MPGFDRTGPQGRGFRTGRGFGQCSSTAQDAVPGAGAGRGLGPRGCGRGRCFGGGNGGRGFNRFRQAGPDSDIESLQARADRLKAELERVEKSMSDTNP